jgi:hypothetical protein
MATRIESSPHLPLLDAFSARDRKTAESALARADERRRRASEARERAMSKLALEFRGNLRKLLGDKKLATLREAMAHEKLALRALWQPPVRPDRDDAKENATRKRRVDAVLRGLGSDSAALRELGRKFDERSRALGTFDGGAVVSGHAMSAHRERWAKLSPFNQHALPWGDLHILELDPDDPHRWFVFRPPFFGFNFAFSSQTTQGYTADRVHIVDPPAGLIGYRATLESHDEREYEFGCVSAQSAIAFGFDAPIAGLIEILVDAQSAEGHHHVEMEDDWGWSNSTTWQQNYLSMEVLHPNTLPGAYALMSDFRADFDGDSETVNKDYLVQGQHYFAQSVTSGPVAAGTSVVVQIGTYAFDQSKLNDVSVKSESRFRWFISSVQVRIAP